MNNHLEMSANENGTSQDEQKSVPHVTTSKTIESNPETASAPTGTTKRTAGHSAASTGKAANSTGAKKRDRPRVQSPDLKPWMKLLKSIENLSEAERLTFLGEKFTELTTENKRYATLLDQREKEKNHIERERDHLKSDCNKNILAKNKLENICRELQRQNKQIREENVVKLREEETRRKLTAADLNAKMNDISSMMENASISTLDLQKDNRDMQLKLIQLNATLKQRSDHVEEMKREIDLQKKLSDAIIAKLESERSLEKELWEKERCEMFENLKRSEENCRKLQKSLNEFQDRYQGIEESMLRSNELFSSFQGDFEQMSSNMKFLEKEAADWKRKFYSNAAIIVDLTQDKDAYKYNISKQQTKIERLEHLCRHLQNERSAYLKQLKAHNIEIPVVPDVPEMATTPSKDVKDKIEELKELKKQLNILQKEVPQENIPSTSEGVKPKKNKKKKTDKKKNENTSELQDVPECEIPQNVPENNIHSENVPKEELNN